MDSSSSKPTDAVPALQSCPQCGTEFNQKGIRFCPRCVAQQHALSTAHLTADNWRATLEHTFPHLEILEALEGAQQVFKVRSYETGALAELRIARIDETSDRRAQLRLRSLVEHPRIVHLLDHGWIDGMLYTLTSFKEGSPLQDLLSEGKLSRTQLLAVKEELQQMEASVLEAGFTLDVRPDQVTVGTNGLPMVSSLWPAVSATDYTWLTKDDLSGSEIGRYRIKRLLGEGGFAEVYLALQRRPLKRQVALKILKSGMDTRQIIGRFETERNLLALLDHPNIATVLDAGATASGQPFFAMEYVDGLPLTVHAHQHQFTLEDRLQLFVKLCHAVHHAHEKGVVHRDLKPPNVLVTIINGEPQVKIIDFGIAKVLGGPLGDHTLYTELHQFVGSPGYMSPEQAELGAKVDHKADIYALGALLYELIAGETPIPKERFAEVSHEAKVRLVRDSVPTTLTQCLDQQSSLAELCQNLQTNSDALYGQLRRGLGEIVSKALHRNPNERYATAREFGETIASFLEGEYRKQPWWRKVPPAVVWPFVTLSLACGLFTGLSHCHRVAEEQARRAAIPPPIDPPKLLRDPTRPPLVWVEPGTLVIGAGRDQRPVTFNHPFALGQFEVTQAEYHALFSAQQFFQDEVSHTKPSHFSEAGFHAPVENVSWEDAMRYCSWLTKIETERLNSRLPSGYIYSLPLEAEWEYAVRQAMLSKQTVRVVAKHFTTPVAWFSQNSQVEYSGGTPLAFTLTEGLHGPQPVGRSYPNRQGIYDLQGNVAEWMHDFSVTADGPLISNTIEGPPSNGRAVVRGGSWASKLPELDPSSRYEFPVRTRDQRIGFRVAAVHYESRAYAPIPKYNDYRLKDQQTLRVVANDVFKQPFTLDFETLSPGPIDADHPLFEAIGLESIDVQSSDFKHSLDPRVPRDRMLWSSQQDQLEVVTSESAGPFANSLSYTLCFKEPQQAVGFTLSEHADTVEVEVGMGERLDEKMIIEATDPAVRSFMVSRVIPFDRLKLQPYFDSLRQDGETIGMIDASGFALDQIVMECTPPISQQPIGHTLTTSTSPTAFVSSFGRNELKSLTLGREQILLAAQTAKQTASASALGDVLVFSKKTGTVPFDLDWRCSAPFEFQIDRSADGITIASKPDAEACHLTMAIREGECRLMAFKIQAGVPRSDDRLILYGDDPALPVAIYRLTDFPQSPEALTSVNLRSTLPIRQLVLVKSLRDSEALTIRDCQLGSASALEGWRMTAPHLPAVALVHGGRVGLESNALLETCFPNQRAVTAQEYLRHPLIARLPVGAAAVRFVEDYTNLPVMRGFTPRNGMAFFPTDDRSLQSLNRATLYSTEFRDITNRALNAPSLKLRGTIPAGQPQSYHHDGVTLTLTRRVAGNISLHALGKVADLDQGKAYQLVAGLSSDGVQRDWDMLSEPLQINTSTVERRAGIPFWEISRSYPCALSMDRAWAYVFWIRRHASEASISNRPLTESPKDWKALRSEVGEELHVLKQP